jgi:hypothetical protein
VIHQHHQVIDPADNPGIDTPFRCFRPDLGIQFYGTVHEQPAFGLNRLPEPSLTLQDVDIIHFGYLDKGTIRKKCVERNMSLVAKDQYIYPNRVLGKLNILRDMIHLAQFDLEKSGGVVTEKVKLFLRSSATLHLEHFTDPKNPYNPHSLAFYQRALALLATLGVPFVEGDGIPFEAQVQLVVVPGGITEPMSIPKPQRLWFSSRKEFESAVLKQCGEIFRKFGGIYAATSNDEESTNGHRHVGTTGHLASSAEIHSQAIEGEALRDDRSPDREGRADHGDVPAEAETSGTTG